MHKILFMIGLLLFSMAANAERQVLSIGDKAPNFTLSRLNGSQFQLSDYKGKKPVYLIFWNTWCGYCIKKVPQINALARQHRDDIEILAINTSWSDNKALISEFQGEHQTDYPMAFDESAKITDLFDVWGSPTEFIIDINGKIQHRDKVPAISESHLNTWSKRCTEEVC